MLFFQILCYIHQGFMEPELEKVETPHQRSNKNHIQLPVVFGLRVHADL